MKDTITSPSHAHTKQSTKIAPPFPYETWIKTDTLEINFNPKNFSIFVTEQAPIPTRIALCGGGSRLPAHVGALEAFFKRGFSFSEFSGSSAGAMIATFAYLGYSISEIHNIISWYDDEKLMDNPMQLSLGSLKKLLIKGGLSSTKFLHQAAHYVILEKIINIISSEHYRHRFIDHQGFLQEHVYNAPYSISFSTLARIKELCPECSIGENLVLIGTDLETEKSVVFSAATTPDMSVADAVVISANLPLAFETITHDGKKYSDGGITKNYPIDCFAPPKRESFFLQHKSGVDYTVIGLQFDNGYEGDAIYSAKPVHKWDWLSRVFYNFVTGHSETTKHWSKDLEALRLHAHQTVLIPTPEVRLTTLSLDGELHEKMVESGRKAARDYLNHHGYYTENTGKLIRNEWMYEKFVRPDDLLEYCYTYNHTSIIKQLEKAIASSEYLEKGYQQYVRNLCQSMLHSMGQKNNGQSYQHRSSHKSSEAKPAHEIKSHLGDSRWVPRFFAPTTHDEPVITTSTSIINIQLFTKLYPLLMQNWSQLCPVSGIGDIFTTIRKQLFSIDGTQTCLQYLMDQLNTITAGHFIIFIVKAVLALYEESRFDHLYIHLKKIYTLVDSLLKNNLHGDDRYYGQWRFDIEDSEAVFTCIQEENWPALYALLDAKSLAFNYSSS